MVLHREPITMVIEPYAPNIVRITLSLLRDQAIAAPGYGFTAVLRRKAGRNSTITMETSIVRRVSWFQLTRFVQPHRWQFKSISQILQQFGSTSSRHYPDPRWKNPARHDRLDNVGSQPQRWQRRNLAGPAAD